MISTPKPLNAVAAIRVSTTKQGAEGDSPEAQKEQIKRYAEARNIKIKKYFEFLESASKEIQPMQKAVDYCKNPRNRIQLLIVKSIDRFTRGGSYSYSMLKRQLDQSDVRLVDLYGIIGTQKVNTLEQLGVSYSWSVYDPTKNSEILEAERASDEKRDIMSRLMGAEIRYTRLGYWMRVAPYGYATKRVNTSHGKRIVLIPHPAEAQYVIRMFDLRCRGTLTDQQIADELNRLGFRSRTSFVRSKTNSAKIVGERGGEPMTCKRLQKLLTNTLYAGINCEKWTNNKPVRCHFDALVSVETFNKANRGKIAISPDYQQIARKSKGTDAKTPAITKNTRHYPYRRVVLCPYCLGPFTGSASRGRNGKTYKAYHCSRYGHYFRIPKQRFDDTVENFVSLVRIEPHYVDQLAQAISKEWCKRQDTFYADLERKIEFLHDTKDQMRLVANNLRYLRSETAIEYLEGDLVKLEVEAKRIQDDIKLSQRDAPPSVEDIIPMAHRYINHIDELLLTCNETLPRQALIGVLFDALPTYNELVNATGDDKLADGINPLFSRKEAVESNLSPKGHRPRRG